MRSKRRIADLQNADCRLKTPVTGSTLHSDSRVMRVPERVFAIRSLRVTSVIALLLVPGFPLSARGESITVLSSNGFKAVLQDLAPLFEHATGHQLAITYSVSTELKKRIDSGERFDVAILTPGLIDALVQQKTVVPETRATLARSGLGVAIRRGAPKPDMSTVRAFTAALLASRSIAFAKEGAAGVAFVALVGRLGLTEQLSPKFRAGVTGDDVSRAVAAGEAELGILPLSEILPVSGVEVAGPFPADVQEYAVMVGAVSAAAREATAARQLMEFLVSSAALPVIEKRGMERPR